MTLPSSWKAGRSFGERLDGHPGARMLVLGERLVPPADVHRDDLGVEHTGGERALRERLAAGGEAVLLGAIDPVALGDLLGRDAHQIAAPRIGQQRERAVDELVRPQAPAVARLPVEERLAAHALVAAGHDDAGIAELNLLGRRDDRLQARGAEAVDVHRRRRRRKAGGQRAAPRVVGVGPDLPDLAHHDLVDLAGVDPRRGEYLTNAQRSELVRLDVLEAPAEAADRGTRAPQRSRRPTASAAIITEASGEALTLLAGQAPARPPSRCRRTK